MIWDKYSFRLLCIVVVLLNLSCIKYSFKGALPSNLKTVAIPLFEDRSRWVGLQEEMTQQVVDAFIQDNTLQVIEDESEVDLLLKGTIVSVRERNTSVSSSEQVEEQELVVSVKVECLNTHLDKPLWSGTVSDFATVSGTASLEEREAAVIEATEKIVEEILNRTVAAW